MTNDGFSHLCNCLYVIAMENIKEKYGTRSQADLKCYIEIADKPTATPNGKFTFFPNEGQTGYFMIFIKYYDPLASRLEYVFTWQELSMNGNVPRSY